MIWFTFIYLILVLNTLDCLHYQLILLSNIRNGEQNEK